MPPHFSLGRNRKLQGLANATVKLWETSAIAKIAIKRCVANTCNDREWLKRLSFRFGVFPQIAVAKVMHIFLGIRSEKDIVHSHGTLAETQAATSRWGKELSNEDIQQIRTCKEEGEEGRDCTSQRRREVFYCTIENAHLHWKHRELVKLNALRLSPLRVTGEHKKEMRNNNEIDAERVSESLEASSSISKFSEDEGEEAHLKVYGSGVEDSSADYDPPVQ
ncbi:hypothetical protein MLD38_005824 [Melastoma candidum]|uniref:Uncharacterized protein n=1 Tax=Melastoma candidum TaxID=119954 RepID=A0ACB9RKI6_9MYRT|nr:hypothetical protein MLD38_005824 [Melastoma candidum]